MTGLSRPLENLCFAVALWVGVALSTPALALDYGEPRAGFGCQNAEPCMIGDRSYQIRIPQNWDGQSPLPVLFHFHGWGRQAPVVLKHDHIAGATEAAGYLLVAPNGLGKSWSFWRPGSDDTQFAKQVLAQVRKRFPVDTDRILVSGYSWGGSMAWRFVCEAPQEASMLLSIAGTLYDQGETCARPVEMRHVHGTKDTVMDYPYGPNGELTGSVLLWRQMNGCGSKPTTQARWQSSNKNRFERYSWESCTSGMPVTLDVHHRGHHIPAGWLVQQLEELAAKSVRTGTSRTNSN